MKKRARVRVFLFYFFRERVRELESRSKRVVVCVGGKVLSQKGGLIFYSICGLLLLGISFL